MLPPSHIKDVFNRSEREIEVLRPQNETIEAFYTLGDPELYDNAFHFKVVRNQLTRSIPHFSESIAEELQLGLDLYWGTSNEWKTVRIFEFCRNVIARAANRVFVGPVLCRDEYYLEQARQYALSVFGGALVIRLFPKFMKPVVGRLVGLKSKWHASNVEHIILPIVIDRLENAKKKQVDSEFSWVEPEDALQWIIEECLKAGDSKQLNPRLIVKRLLSLSMVSMHSTSFTVANTLIDLFSSSGYTEALEVIREEIENTLRESNGAWTKTAVVNLQHIDSTIRESMRCSAFGIAALPRVVAHPKGIDINGYNIPKGIKLAVAMNQVHYDQLFYSNPTCFDALRFSRSLSTDSAPLTETGMEDKMRDMNDEAGNPAGSLELSAATLSDRFLSFGYGRHACPGRFFAVHEMKILLSLVLRNYDIEPLGKYPARQTLVEVQLPSEYTTLRIRRRNQ
ncbi:hypothetical protein BOTNAR_0131g00070 [Botryotinia narcissicola]|uniref:Cytochrome P450 n=1 Tax=Botryotinia narcissicola TaxID=278944 RepID=A0A4Z1II58_9HELO|nr:hypothetical protein BOTNAR_0131g00070 [Botryotinia narcissicola]